MQLKFITQRRGEGTQRLTQSVQASLHHRYSIFRGALQRSETIHNPRRKPGEEAMIKMAAPTGCYKRRIITPLAGLTSHTGAIPPVDTGGYGWFRSFGAR